jgi:hypothetical protein
MNYPKYLPVEMIVNEPWEWGSILGCGPFSAKILEWKINQNDEATDFLLSLLTSQKYKGIECTYFIGSPRYKEEPLKGILQGKELSCGLVCIPKERAISLNPFDLSWWRGGIGLICSIRRTTQAESN